MQKIAVTGCASRFAKVLLPLLEADPNIEQIKGTLICSNAKLKATGTWAPRYTTTQAFAATVKTLA